MSDSIKHECGIAMIRLLKPLEFYHKKYGTALYGLNKLYLMLLKQHNRGQDGAGIATIKLDMPPGHRYISRKRDNSNKPIQGIFDDIYSQYFNPTSSENMADSAWLKANLPYVGELLLGHLRYGTHGKNKIENCHPFLRQNNWITRNLVLAGNFNLTNVDELFGILVNAGQYPKQKSDTVTVLEKIGHFLDMEVQRLFNWYKSDGFSNEEITQMTIKNLDITRILEKAAKDFDGGYVMAGMLGHGDAFVMRDPSGIRPAFYYKDDEVVVVASERPAIQTAFNIHISKVKELKPAHALIIKKNGKISEKQFIEPLEKQSCSFERIYFSRGTDRDIYIERKQLGHQLAKKIMKAVDYDFENTVFSFVPNTAESCFFGMMDGIQDELNKRKTKELLKLGPNADEKTIKKLLSQKARMEKLVIKDAKLRTFITDDASRGDLVKHIYDVTYGIVKNEKDTLVLVDDSIVRGTTLKQSIISIVSRLRPKKIIIISSAPQIRYPDCYGIDMSKLKDFVAFRAVIKLIKESGQKKILDDVYKECLAQLDLPKDQVTNQVARLYDLFTVDEISKKISEIVTPKGIKPKVDIIFQSLSGLHAACPDHTGDWYFSGKFPTSGGNLVVNRAFINYMEKVNTRAY